jgi:RimJ/RimL family protein N-acetyltransferase
MTDIELLALDAAASFVLTGGGRILRTNSPASEPPPRLHVARCSGGNVLHLRRDVGESAARALEALVADEPPLRDPDGDPVHLDAYVQIIAAEAPVERRELGLAWIFPEHLDYASPVPLICSHTPEGDRLLAHFEAEGMPAELVALGFVDTAEFWPPWCVALDGEEIASIAFAARLGPAAAETGVATVPALRGRGFAAAATAGWASHPALSGHTLFYSTSRENRSSQRVAERLGLRFLGATFTIY